MSRFYLVILGLLGVVIVVGGIANVVLRYNGTIDDSNTPNPTNVDAEYACNNFVRDELKAPSTAHFNADTSNEKGDSWFVQGSVDAQNGFGAQLRNDFMCTIHLVGDQWILDNLEFT